MSMQIIRAYSVRAADEIKHLLLPDEDGVVSIDDQVVQLKNLLTYNAEQVLLLICIENNKIEGFGLALAPIGYSHVLIDQVWLSKTAQRMNIAEAFFSAVKTWAVNKGRLTLRILSARDPYSISRKYGFQAVTSIMEKKLVEHEVLTTLETNNGQRQISQNDDDNDESAEADQRRDDKVPQEQVGSGSDAVERPATGTVRPSDGDDRGLRSERDNVDADKGAAGDSVRSISVD